MTSMGIGVDLGWAPFQIDANMGWTAAIQDGRIRAISLMANQPQTLKLQVTFSQ